MSGLTAALQPTHRAAQLLLSHYTDADQHIRAAEAFPFSATDFQFSATNVFVLETASHTEDINYKRPNNSSINTLCYYRKRNSRKQNNIYIRF